MSEERSLEDRLLDHARMGTTLDLRGEASRDVPADVVYRALTAASRGEPAARAVRLYGARVVGALDLDAAKVDCPLQLDSCAMTEPVVLREGRAPSVALTSCTVPGVLADGLDTLGDLVLATCDIAGGVTLVGARIGGRLVLNGSTILGETDRALLADGLRVDIALLARPVGQRRFSARGEVRLLGATIGAEVNFSGAEIVSQTRSSLNVDGADVGQSLVCVPESGHPFKAVGQLRFVGGHVGGHLLLDGADLMAPQGAALDISGLRIDQQLLCRGRADHRFTARGVRMIGASVGGQLSFEGAAVSSGDGAALDGDGLDVGGDAFFRPLQGRRFTAQGEVRLVGATIRGQLGLRGAELVNPRGRALSADGVTVRQGVFCTPAAGHRLNCQGEFRIVGAQLETIHLDGAHLENPGGIALLGDRANVSQNLHCRVIDGQPFSATGEIRLPAATVGGQLAFVGAQLNGPGTTLNLAEATIRSLSLRFESRPLGQVNLSDAHIGALYDRAYEGPDPWPRMELEGCTYERLAALPSEDPGTRLKWFGNGPSGYSPQPYEQLAEVYRRSGQDDAARRVRIAKERRRRKTLRPGGKIWSLFLGATVAHGYRQSQALAWLIILLVSGALLFGEVYEADEHRRPGVDLTPAKTRPAPFEPVIYTLDLLVPVISLGQRTSWNAHGGAQWVGLGLTVLGWLLTAALLAGIGARRQ